MRDYADSDTVRATIQVEVKENIHKGFTPVSSTVSKPVFILKKGNLHVSLDVERSAALLGVCKNCFS